MNTHRHGHALAQIGLIVAFFPLLGLCGCAQQALTTRTTATLSPRQKSQLVELLETAKTADQNGEMDPHVTPMTRDDFIDQKLKVDRVIRELTHGFEVPESEVADSLWVPPKSITDESRTQLIRQLQIAKKEDDHNEQEMMNDYVWGDSIAPLDTVTFDQQMKLVDSVIEDLEIGEPVSWSTIREALYVPPSPY
jgi:hypothetical protein